MQLSGQFSTASNESDVDLFQRIYHVAKDCGFMYVISFNDAPRIFRNLCSNSFPHMSTFIEVRNP